jgi:PD-(D/E)XK endonuclease
MTPKFSLYLGEAGQASATSYFLARGWNVATPKVDVGDDLVVIEDNQGFFVRIQVKTARAIERQGSFGVRFKVPLKQLQKQYNPELYYMFMVYREQEWLHKIIIPRSALLDKFLDDRVGSILSDSLILYFTFQGKKVICSGIDFSEFYNNFEDFPQIEH